MKSIKGLTQPTPGLQRYLNAYPWQGITRHTEEWERFRKSKKSAYKELLKRIKALQNGLCAFCETELKQWPHDSPDHQIEHFHPKSQACNATSAIDWMFTPDNLLAACAGGLSALNRLPPIHENLSCGQAKGDQILDDIILKPSTLPLQPSLFTVTYEGLLKVNAAHCAAVGIPVERAQQTIEKLNLNCPRLKTARRTVMEGLEAEEQALGIDKMNDAAATAALTAMARRHLLPDRYTHCLPPFFTTRRSFFLALGERVIAQGR